MDLGFIIRKICCVYTDRSWQENSQNKNSCSCQLGVSPYCTQREDINFTVFVGKFKHRNMSQISSKLREAISAGISQSAIFKFSQVPEGQSILVAIILSTQSKWNGCVFFFFFFFVKVGDGDIEISQSPCGWQLGRLTAAASRLWVSFGRFSGIVQ